MGLEVKALLGIGGVPQDDFWGFAQLADLYWDQRQAGRLGLKQEDVEEHLVEILVEWFDFDAGSGHYVHHDIEALINAGGGKGRVDAAFEDFWKLYPRKVAKVSALKAWRRNVRTDKLAKKIISAVHRQTIALGWRDDLSYCPHPATWLNAGRWDDEVEALPGMMMVDA